MDDQAELHGDTAACSADRYTPEERAERRADLKASIEAAGCSGCQSEANPNAPITMDAARCTLCRDGPMSGSHLHICKTGAWQGVCAKCNAKLPAKHGSLEDRSA